MAEPTHRSTDEARAGTTPHITRYVLAIGLALVVIVLGLVFLWGVGTGPDKEVDTPQAPAIEDRSGSLDTPGAALTPGTAQGPTFPNSILISKTVKKFPLRRRSREVSYISTCSRSIRHNSVSG